MRIVNAAFVATCVLLLPLPTQAQAGKGLAQTEVIKINELSQVSAKAMLAKDWATFAAQYVEDAVLYPPNEPAVKGRAAIRSWLEKFPPVTEFKLTNVKVEGRDDLAYVLGAYTMTLVPPGATPVKDSGKYVEIRRRQADGRWLLAVDMFSSDLPVTPSPK